MTPSVNSQEKSLMSLKRSVQRRILLRLFARFIVLTAFLALNMPLLSGQSDALYISDKGNVGIGTTTPGYQLSVAGPNAAAATGSLQLTTQGSAQGERSSLSLFSTFQNTIDNGPRRAADIIAGFNAGAWGKEYLSFHVGNNGSSNDGQNITSEKMRIQANGNVGIGTNTPAFPLSFPDKNGDKISLYGQTGTHYGFGVQNLLLQVQTPDAKSDIAFGYGMSDKFIETMHLSGTGDVALNDRMFLLGRPGDPKSPRGTFSITNNAFLDSNNAWQIKDTTKKAFTMEVRDSGVLDLYGTVTDGKADWRQMANFDAPNNKIEFPGNESKVIVRGKLYVGGGIAFYWGPRKAWFTIEHGSGGSGGSISVGQGNATGPSDLRLKTDIQPIPSALEKINRLRGVTFHWNEQGLEYLTRDISTSVSAGPGASDEENQKAWREERAKEYKELSTTNIGVVAQDVEGVLPEAVTTDESGYKSVNYYQLIPLMVEALKEEDKIAREQAQTITRQQTEIKRLAGSNQAAEQQLAELRSLKQQLAALQATVARMMSPEVRAAGVAQTHPAAHSSRSQ